MVASFGLVFTDNFLQKPFPQKKQWLPHLSGAAASALAAPSAQVPVLLVGGAALQVNVQHRLVDELGVAVLTRHRLLVC